MPEAVPLSFPTMALLGHDEAKRQIESAFDSGRMPHAWLFVGPEGIGKASLAFAAAQMILSGGQSRFDAPMPHHPAARMLAAQAHPDFFLLRRSTDEKTGATKESISVENARKLAPFMSMTPSQGCGRVALVDEAHTLTRSAQNAVLKGVEEPPRGAVLFLTTTSAGALLPTLRSRCRFVPLRPLTEAQMSAILARLGTEVPSEPASRARLFSLAGGSVSRALQLLETEALPLFDELTSLLKAMPRLDLARAHALADKIGKKTEANAFGVIASLFVETLRLGVRAIALGQNDSIGLAEKTGRRLDTALALWEDTARAFSVAESANLDKKLAFLNALATVSRMTTTSC